MSFKEIARIEQVPAGTMKGFELEGQTILVANIDGKYYAMQGKCTHMGGILPNGKLEGTVVTCPRHGSRFDVTTGKNLSGPKIAFIKVPHVADEPTYPTRVDGSSLQIDI